MVYDIDMLRSFYSNFPKRVDAAREQVGRPLTLAEKIIIMHICMKNRTSVLSSVVKIM